jgi:hypothetical protein
VSDASPTQRRSLLDRYLSAFPVVVAVLALLALLFWEASIRRTPTINTDEFEWTQISRAIAATGHAARRGEPISFKSLYAFLIAPAWWLHATGAAYAVAKYVNTIVMALAAVPTYLLARTLVPQRAAIVAGLASLCTTALYYAGFLLPEVLAYPTFALGAWVTIRALSGDGRRWTIAAIAIDLVAIEVRSELVTLPAAFALAAALLWIVGPRGQRLRRDWGMFDYIGATLLLVGAFVVLNRAFSPTEWKTVTESFKGRLFSLGFQAGSALAIGLGLLPVVGGLASLWLPERREDPRWRAFAAFTASAVFTVGTYTAVKAAFLSTNFATRVEERNLIYLGPLLIVGTAVWLCAERRFLPGAIAAWAFTAWLVLHYGYQLDFPYFEAPGYGVAALANRAWHWDQSAIRLALGVACAILLGVILVRGRARRAVLLLAVAVTLTWMLAGEIESSRGSAIQSATYAGNMVQPLDWIDRATNGTGVTYIGQDISSGEALGVLLTEFWNHSIKHVVSLDGTAPGPGPRGPTPDLANRFGVLTHDPGLPYVVATDGINLVGTVVAREPGLTLKRIDHHPWALHQALYGVSNDGWTQAANEQDIALGRFAYFGPERSAGTLTVQIGRPDFCPSAAPSTHIGLRIGPLELDEQRSPLIAHAQRVERFVLKNCSMRTIRLTVTPPVAVRVTAFPTFLPRDYGIGDDRHLGAQVGFAFKKLSPKR